MVKERTGEPLESFHVSATVPTQIDNQRLKFLRLGHRRVHMFFGNRKGWHLPDQEIFTNFDKTVVVRVPPFSLSADENLVPLGHVGSTLDVRLNLNLTRLGLFRTLHR